MPATATNPPPTTAADTADEPLHLDPAVRGNVVWIAAPSMELFVVALFLSGGVIAPALTVMAGLVAKLTPASMQKEAYTWLTTISMGLSALGAAVAGLVVDSAAGSSGAFALAAVATGVGLALTSGLRRAATVPTAVPVALR